MRILITGGSGFIGSNLIRYILLNTEHEVVNVDKLTYAGNVRSLKDLTSNKRFFFLSFLIFVIEKKLRVFLNRKHSHVCVEAYILDFNLLLRTCKPLSVLFKIYNPVLPAGVFFFDFPFSPLPFFFFFFFFFLRFDFAVVVVFFFFFTFFFFTTGGGLPLQTFRDRQYSNAPFV